MPKIPVYFMPGLAAGPSIFENISLPEDEFEAIFLEWNIPLEKESLRDYAKRMSEKIMHKNPVLIGVSFGGILVQEMAVFVNPSKVIIISSVRSKAEFPRRMKMAGLTRAYKLIPYRLLLDTERMARGSFHAKIRQRLKLYEKYLWVRDVSYLEWAMEQVIRWDRRIPDMNVIHIHGDSDEIFPAKYLQSYIPVKGGTHIMIIDKFRWFNENLPKLIRNKS